MLVSLLPLGLATLEKKQNDPVNSDPFAVVPVKAPILDGMDVPIKTDVGDVFIFHLGSGYIVIHGVSDKPSFSDSYY
ncbi:hypothetical protein G6F23_009697 [Rhizopus arrhizus]|nr:hypothetical protein G6F23_009697 [Rhizopus arrhizus]